MDFFSKLSKIYLFDKTKILFCLVTLIPFSRSQVDFSKKYLLNQWIPPNLGQIYCQNKPKM